MTAPTPEQPTPGPAGGSPRPAPGPAPASGPADDRRRPAPRPPPATSNDGTNGGTSDSTAGATGPGDQGSGPLDPQTAFAELGRLMLDQPVGQYLQKVADLAARVLPDVDGLSVTLVEDGTARTAAFTSTAAALLDERQYEAGFGPCLDAATTGNTIRVTTDDDDVYPAFTKVAHRQGVTHTTSVGMPVPQQVVGALNLYSTSGTIDDDTVALARTFASYAAVALANASLYGSTARLATQLQEAMDSRAVIEQAKGILMANYHLDADEAFAHLARASQHANVKLRVLAADIVERSRRGERI